MIEVVLFIIIGGLNIFCTMKRSRAPSALASSQTTTTTTVVKKKPRSEKTRAFSVPRWVGKSTVGFPKELRMKHRYVTTGSFSSLNGAVHTNNYSCNGMFDPDITGVGHQPMYFDQLAAIYNHYTVVVSKITVQASPRPSNTLPVAFGIYLNDDSTIAYSDINSFCETSSAVWTYVSPSSDSVRLSKKFKAAEHFGPNVIGDPNLQGTSGANPTEVMNYTVFVTAPAGTASTERLDCIITIEYTAVWQELKEIAAS